MSTSEARHLQPPIFSREELLTATEVASVLHLRRTTALDYMRRGLVPAFKLGRQWYSLRSQLESYLGAVAGPGDM